MIWQIIIVWLGIMFVCLYLYALAQIIIGLVPLWLNWLEYLNGVKP